MNSNENFLVTLNKLNKRCDKIMSFFETKMPKEFFIINDNFFYRESFIDVATENFLTPENMKKDFKHFSWKEKIEERLDEKYGLKIIYH